MNEKVLIIMSAILADHGTVASTNPGESGAHDSFYCYMFKALAEEEWRQTDHNGAKHFENLNLLANLVDGQKIADKNNSILPAIYTYFGQFINHDLSAPTATPLYLSSVRGHARDFAGSDDVVTAGADVVALMSPERPPNPDWLAKNIINQHPRPLGLHSLYGSGPNSKSAEIKELYDLGTMKFRLGQTFNDPDLNIPKDKLDTILDHDLVRAAGVAKIADRRNDENLVIAQLHLAFMLFHNQAIEVLKPKFADKMQLFDAARALVTRHYHHCILHDYLKHLVPNESAGSSINWDDKSAVPFEFTTAAFRFGHSMISSTYDYNGFFGESGLISETATLKDLFDFTSRGKMGQLNNQGSRANIEGKLPSHWVIDWARFLRATNVEGSGAEHIDLVLPENMVSLGDLATLEKMMMGLGSIAHRNIKRGYHRFMPSGQEVASKLGLTPLTHSQIASAFPRLPSQSVLTEAGFDRRTPLWVYFLCEAKLKGGNVLGPAAGAIVRGTITQLIRHNQANVAGLGGLNWKPEDSPLRLSNGHPITDIRTFLQFAGVLS